MQELKAVSKAVRDRVDGGQRLACFSKSAGNLHQHIPALAGVVIVRLLDGDHYMHRPLQQNEKLLQQLLHHGTPLQCNRS